jgi:hypothetical protein
MILLSTCHSNVTESYDVIGEQTCLGRWQSTTKEDLRNQDRTSAALDKTERNFNRQGSKYDWTENVFDRQIYIRVAKTLKNIKYSSRKRGSSSSSSSSSRRRRNKEKK